MPEELKKENLTFDDSVKVNKKGEAILGRLYGPVAEFIAPTRNGRMYDEETWDKVFKKPLVKEMFEAGGLLGELNHPEDRLETDLSKVCVCMPEPPKKNKNGCLTATFDILDTPNGRIVETLAKYGYKLGVSSRADGDTFEGYDGVSHVDSDTFDLKGFDIVLLPAVKKARLSLEESLSKDVRTALIECLNSSSIKDKQIMLESLNGLHIDVQGDSDNVVEDTPSAVNNGEEVVAQLQEALKLNREQEKQVKELQEKLSVCYAKEAKMEESLTKYKSSISTLGESIRSSNTLKQKVAYLSEQIAQKEQTIVDKNKQISELKQRLLESVSSKKKLLENCTESKNTVNSLTEELEATRQSFSSEKASLLENIEDIKKDSEIKLNKLAEKVKKANALVEHYKQSTKKSVDKYIELKACLLGVSPREISNRLTENYSFEDIDKICESLQSYKLSLGKLPFDIPSKNTKIVMSESKEPIRPRGIDVDDEIDDSLLRMAGLQ